MLDIKRDANVALDFLDGKTREYYKSNYNVTFDNTNERIDLLLKKFDINEKKVLTVASSGDQILEFINSGAKEIHAFDKNPFAIYFSKLKIAAVTALGHNEFINYFHNLDHSSYLSKRIYRKIDSKLDEKARYFWDVLYFLGKVDQKYFNLIFFGGNDSLNSDTYNNKNNYYKLKEKLDNIKIKYYCNDIFDLHTVVDSDYDYIFLSNIYDWINNSFNKSFCDYVRHELYNRINEKGMIFAYTTPYYGFLPNELKEEFEELKIDAHSSSLILKK